MNLSNSTYIPNQNLQNYNDLNALQQLKHSAKDADSKDAALDAVAKQFESLFVSMMIKSMRDANKGFSEGNLLQSSETDFYQQMFDSQLAVSISTSKGLGLSEVIKRQLSPDLSRPQAGKDGFALAGYGREIAPMKMHTGPELDAALQQVQSGIDTLVSPNTGARDPVGWVVEATQQSRQDDPGMLGLKTNPTYDGKVSPHFESPQDFIEKLYPMAQSVEQQTGIDARLMLAQSALETGWGKHQIYHANGQPSFNLFGIKAQPGWGGERAQVTTTEYRGGVAMKEQAEFRSYDSFRESFRDYAEFLTGQQRYQPALASKDDPKAFAYALQDSGYATDPAYGDKIVRILDQYLAEPEPLAPVTAVR